MTLAIELICIAVVGALIIEAHHWLRIRAMMYRRVIALGLRNEFDRGNQRTERTASNNSKKQKLHHATPN